MTMDIDMASLKIGELEFNFMADHVLLDVHWFRPMAFKGSIGRHTHSSYEFHYICRGACKVATDALEFEASAGQFYLTAPGVFHSQSHIGEEGFVEYCLNCEIKLLEVRECEFSHAVHIFNTAACKPIRDTNGIMNLFEQAFREAYDRDFGFYNRIKSTIILILLGAAKDIAKETGIMPSYSPPVRKPDDHSRYIRICRFIKDNIGVNLSTKDIASHMDLSEKQIGRIIEKNKGLSTKKLLMEMKLEQAKAWLVHTNLPVKGIADKLGFSSEFYFSQFFKREEGLSPILFRSSNQPFN